MKAKQLNAQSYGVTSSTARRILQSLEKMSSPLAVKFEIMRCNAAKFEFSEKVLILLLTFFCYCNVNRMQKEFHLQFLLL
jgi:hypothetical protein